MIWLRAFVIGVCLGASSLARADTPADQTANAEREANFNWLVEQGNRARLSGRHSDAARAYTMALELQHHPVVSGRLGLMLMKLGQLDRAAEELHEAFERGQGVTLQERREVTEAYDKAKSATTWVSVMISHVGSTVTCDDKPWNHEGTSSFWRFVMPGEHTIRAKLDGYEDAVETFTAKAGEEITVTLKFVPVAVSNLPELPSPIATNPPEKRTFPPYLPTSNTAGASDYDPKEDPSYGEPKETKPMPRKTGPRFSVNGGVVTVFGVASWNPAVGAVVGVGLRPSDYFSVGVEGRAAWLTTGVADQPINAMTAGGILSACGHLRWFLGCGLGHVGAIIVELDPSGYKPETDMQFKPGLGARLGARKRLGNSFELGGTFDAMWLRTGTRIVVKETEIVAQPPVLLSFQMTGGWEF